MKTPGISNERQGQLLRAVFAILLEHPDGVPGREVLRQMQERFPPTAYEAGFYKTNQKALGLRDDELAFYDAVCQNDSAVMELGDEVLKKIAQELVEVVRSNATVDWDKKEQVRVMVPP